MRQFMGTRRHFLKSLLLSGASYFSLSPGRGRSTLAPLQIMNRTPPFAYLRDVPTRMYDGKRCWCHPRAGIVPLAVAIGLPRVVMTMNTLDVDGSDVFKGMHGLRTDDLGRTWTDPREIDKSGSALRDNRRRKTSRRRQRLLARVACCVEHAAGDGTHGRLHDRLEGAPRRPRHTAYAATMPNEASGRPGRSSKCPTRSGSTTPEPVARSGSTKPMARFCWPIYLSPPGTNSRVTVVRVLVRWKEHWLHSRAWQRAGHRRQDARPSRTVADALRGRVLPHCCATTTAGYVTASRDGLHFDPLITWTFDDGTRPRELQHAAALGHA